MDLLMWTLIWVAVMGGIGMGIGAYKGRLGAGFFFGALLGVIGWLVVGLGPKYSEADRRKATRPRNW